MHNSLGSSEATLALLFICFCLLRKPKNSFCNKLRAILHALNHLCSSLRVPTQMTLSTNPSTRFRKQQCECKSFLQGPPCQNPSYTLHPKMQLLLLGSVIKFVWFLHLHKLCSQTSSKGLLLLHLEYHEIWHF